MLKWTASAQKLQQMSATPSAVSMLRNTPHLSEAKRRKRRATIANKENIPITSTPMVPQHRARSSPIVTAPLTDILNITPEPIQMLTPERRRVQTQRVPQTRRHSTIGLTLPSAVPQYARTLPRYEEEYSPSADLPTGQQLALRGLVPPPLLGNARYFNTPDVARITNSNCEFGALENKALPRKRRLEPIFAELADEAAPKIKPQLLPMAKPFDTTAVNSTKMGDETLDKLIDAILDSARKDEKKKKTRKSFNLRRRTLLKNQAECSNDVMLSPSYAPGDDPASDLSFLRPEPSTMHNFPAHTPQQVTSILINTPAPATPLPGTPIPDAVLQQLPTPAPAAAPLLSRTFLHAQLALPAKAKKRRHQRPPSDAGTATPPKKFKVDARNYFEVGLALPSIYV